MVNGEGVGGGVVVVKGEGRLGWGSVVLVNGGGWGGVVVVNGCGGRCGERRWMSLMQTEVVVVVVNGDGGRCIKWRQWSLL